MPQMAMCNMKVGPHWQNTENDQPSLQYKNTLFSFSLLFWFLAPTVLLFWCAPDAAGTSLTNN